MVKAPGTDARPTQEPIRVKGGTAFLTTQMGILITLVMAAFGLFFQAGSIKRQVDVNTISVTDHGKALAEISTALGRVQAISEAQALGKDVDRTAIEDIRQRIAALEARR